MDDFEKQIADDPAATRLAMQGLMHLARHKAGDAYWRGHPARLSNKTIRLLLDHEVYSVEQLMALEPTAVYLWDNCGRKTMNELGQVTGWNYDRVRAKAIRGDTPYLDYKERQRRVFDGWAKRLRAAGWTVTPPD